ncbi:MAG: hypothetical protein JW773_03945 [Desulfuromonadales bacterium]|nr:hypothetical protein [Desulfuromonadales bacterium]
MKSEVKKTFPLPPQGPSAKTLTMLVYALQAASFLLGLTLFVAVIINYVKREEVRGTWLESHFRWQIRTFWFSLWWSLLGVLTFVAVIGYFILIADMLWLIYRIVKGWLQLANAQPMYDSRVSER